MMFDPLSLATMAKYAYGSIQVLNHTPNWPSFDFESYAGCHVVVVITAVSRYLLSARWWVETEERKIEMNLVVWYDPTLWSSPLLHIFPFLLLALLPKIDFSNPTSNHPHKLKNRSKIISPSPPSDSLENKPLGRTCSPESSILDE